MYLLKEIIKCFETEALADKENVIGLQGQLLVQKDEQLKLLKTSVEETVETTVKSGIQSYSAAVQQNSASGTVCNSNILKKVMKSVAARGGGDGGAGGALHPLKFGLGVHAPP